MVDGGVDVRRDIRRVIVGLQGSGKTVLAKSFIARYKKRGISTLVIDYGNEYDGKGFTAFRLSKDRSNPAIEIDAAVRTLIIEPYRAGVPRSKRYGHLVLDEAPRYLPNRQPLPPAIGEINDVGRHIGIAMTTIARRFSQVNTDLVELAHEIYLFRQSGVNDLRRCDDMRAGLANIVGSLAPHHYAVLDMTTGDIAVRRPVNYR